MIKIDSFRRVEPVYKSNATHNKKKETLKSDTYQKRKSTQVFSFKLQ